MIARAYTYMRWLSLDVVAGAIFVCAFLSRELGVTLSFHELFLLGLSVWLIYTTDHLLDIRKATIITERRAFHARHQRLLMALVLIGLACAAILTSWLTVSVLLAGCVLSCLALGYLFFASHLRGTKEFFGALLYSGGILLVPIVRGELGVVLPVGMLLFFLALLNLLFFALLEQTQDEQEGFHSFVQQFGKRRAVLVIWIVTICNLVGCALIYSLNPSFSIPIFFAGVTLVHMSLFLFGWFHAQERFRIIGDMSFWAGGLALLLV